MRVSFRGGLICISKGMANGLPLAAALGKHEFIMPMSDLKISNAHAGEAVSIAAAIECENMLSKAETWPTWKMPAERIINNIQETLNEIPDKCGLVLNGAINCFSVNTMNTPFLYDPFREYFVKYFSSKGIFTKGYIIFCDLHTSKEINYIEKCFCECIRNYAVLAESTEQIV